MPDLQTLMEEARCLECLAPGQLSYIEASLIRGWSTTPAGFTIEPDDSVEPLLWYDAGTYSLADGALITTSDPWIDQSSSQNNATTTSGREPTFKANIFGSRPAVRLVGAKHLLFSDVTFGNFTVLCVAKAYADSLFLSYNGLNRQVRIDHLDGNKNSVFAGIGSIVSQTAFSGPASDARMNGFVRVGASVTFFDNTATIAGDNTDANAHFLNQVGIIDGGPLNIDIGELVVYNSALSTEDVQALYNEYFKPKFGLP